MKIHSRRREKSMSMISACALAILAALLCTNVLPIFPKVYARRGAQIDKVRLLTIKSPDLQLIAIRTGQIDFLPDLIRPADIETLNSEGYLVTSTLGYHGAFVGFNLMRPYLDDVNLRHALFHAYNQIEIISSIYQYVAIPIFSLTQILDVKQQHPFNLRHPFNPGNIGDMYPAEHTTFGIMAAAGYTYVGTGYGDLTARWEKDGVPLPTWTFYTPTYEIAPASAEHGARITEEWHKCGFNNINHKPTDFNTYTRKVFDDWDFDIFMMSRKVGRFPTYLYDMCHSSQYFPGSNQPVGLNDPVLDELAETVMYSLDHDAAIEAFFDAGDRLYDPQYPQALPYMMMYSRVYFDAAAHQLAGIVNSPGYGSDNAWTWFNLHWNTVDGMRPGTGDSLVIYCNGEEPGTLNYLAQKTAYEANIIELTQDSGIRMDPHTHGDLVWQYSEYPTIAGPITEVTPNGVNIVNGMSVTYRIRDDIYWQDGNKFDADDAIFSLDFLKNNQIPRYISVWQDINDTYQVDALTFKVWANKTSPYYMYNWDKGAFTCPPQVWAALDGQPLATILSYDLEDPTDTGPWSYPLTPNGPKTKLFGTGPFVFDLYDDAGMYADLHNWDAYTEGSLGYNTLVSNPGYFLSTDEMAAIQTELFHLCGDVDRDGWIWAGDKHDFGLSFGKTAGDTGYNPNADLNSDDLVDWEDGAIICAFWGKRKEYP